MIIVSITNTEELIGSPVQKMGLIIVEELNNPSYEFLYWIYENREGNTIILPAFDQDLENHYLPRFRECMTRGDQVFCNWLLINFKRYIHEINLSCIYSLCLIDNIKFIELEMTHKISADYYISQQWLVNLCRQTHISTAASPKNVIRYAEWLISNGRMLILEPDVILSFIEYFVFVTRENPPSDTMKRILFILIIIEPNVRTKLITQLFDLIINHFSIYPVGVSALVQIMGEVGLLSEPSARSLLLSKESDTTGIQNLPVEQMWQLSSRSAPLDQEDAAMRLAIDLISNQYFTDIHKSTQVFRRLVLLDKDTHGTISQFGMIFLRVLLRMNYDYVSHAHVGRMISQGCFLPSLDNMSPHLVDTIVRLILTEGNNRLVPWFDEMIRENKKHVTLYLAIANSIIYDRTLCVGISLERLRAIIVILGTDINIDMMNEENLGLLLTHEIALALLEIFTKKNDKDLNNLADKCLSECMRVGTTLRDYRHYVGPLTLERILRTYDMGIDDCVKEQLNDYVRDNLREYLRILLSEIGDYSCFQALLAIPSKVTDCIYLDSHWVIIGSQKYDVNDEALVSYDSQTYNHCEPCGKTLSEAVFHDLEDNHGIYKCSECSSSGARASCNICMTTDDIKVIICGHTYCKECLTRLTTQYHPSCPMCREYIPTNKVVYSYEEIISKLFEEVDASAENTKAIARSLYDSYHVNEEDSDAEDDLRTE